MGIRLTSDCLRELRKRFDRGGALEDNYMGGRVGNIISLLAIALRESVSELMRRARSGQNQLRTYIAENWLTRRHSSINIQGTELVTVV